METMQQHYEISIHALREEGDPPPRRFGQAPSDFYPRPPRGGRPLPATITEAAQEDFYPRPPRGGRRVVVDERDLREVISIHALREEGD